MAQIVKKSRTVSTRNGYPISESMSSDTFAKLSAVADEMQNRAARNSAMMRRVHS